MRGRTTAERQIESNHAFDQVTFDGTPEASVILPDAGASPLRVVRPRAAANLTEAAVSVESIGRVIKAKRVFILSLLLSGGLCPLINLTLPPCGSDAPRRAGSPRAYRRQRIPCLSGAEHRSAGADSRTREGNHACGYAGAGLFQSIVTIRGYAPDTPRE